MNPDVSHVLALVISTLNLDRQVAREFVSEFEGARNVADLPDWIREFEDLPAAEGSPQ